MKTTTIYTILIGLSAIFISGCEDFLDKNLQENLTQESFPTTEGDALLATNAVYSTTRNWLFNSGGYPILDIMSDDSHKGSNPNDQISNLGPYDNFSFTTSADGLDRWWATLYEGIKRANVVIEKVPAIEMDNDLKNRYVAEARFLRGLFYFDLVRAWGEVPKVTSSAPPLKLEKAGTDEIYELILSDFIFAKDILPLKSQYNKEDMGRATKGAAEAYLAKAYLFQNDFINAEKYALNVISSMEYGLESNFSDANGLAGENGMESIFEVGALSLQGDPGNQYANTQGVRGNPNRGWGFNRPSIDLRDSFEPGDPRMDQTIIFLGDTLDGIEILGDGTTPDEIRNESDEIIEIESYNQKVWIPGTTTVTQWGHNRRLMRYADVLLIAAEALNENEKPDQALIYLELVRDRARAGNDSVLPEITETDKSALRDIIIEERRHELALEQHRFWDLVRTGKAETVLGPLGYVSGRHQYFPIPQSEIDISQGSLTQNINWQ